MTPEQLESLILKTKDPKKLTVAFSSLTDSERKSLSTFSAKLRNQISRGKANKDASAGLKLFLSKDASGYHSPAYDNACLALFAMCPISTIKKADIFISWDNRPVLQDILADRKPDWLDEWINFDMDSEFGTINFHMVRGLYHAGVCQKPVCDGYFAKLAWEMMSVGYGKDEPPKPPLSERLLAEPDMLDDVWRLFEIENQAFNTDGWITCNAPDHYETWPEALIKLAEQGQLDRQRLLDASLQGLLLDIKQNQLSGFHKFHAQLSPDNDELQERQAEYLGLLSHNISHVIKFTLKMLSQLEKNKLLDIERFMVEIAAVFTHETKGNAVTALKMIVRIIKKEVAHTNVGLTAIIEGLKHQHVDVQTTAVNLLNDYQTQLTDEHQEELAAGLDFVSATLKPRVTVLINNKLKTETEPVIEQQISQAELEQMLASLTDEQKSAMSIDDASLVERTGEFIPPINPDVLQHRFIATLEPLQPINNVDELISTVSHAVEIVESPELVERIIDGISRLCDQRPDAFESKVAPLINRLENGGGLGTTQGIADSYGGLRLALADLIFTWLTNKLYQSPCAEYYSESDPEVASITWIRDLTQRVAKQQAQPLIAAATHEGGWIDPLIWVDRLIHYEQNQINFDRMDFCLSLLRLMPDNRLEARQRLQALSDEIRPVVDFALGGESVPGFEDRNQYDIWISAARCREPHGNWARVFESLQLHDTWPDSVYPAIYRWRTYMQKEETYSIPRMNIEITSEAQDREEQSKDNKGKVNRAIGKLGRMVSKELETDWERLPTAVLNHRSVLKHRWEENIHTTWITQWLECQWPLNPEPIYLLAVKQLMYRIDMDSSNWEPSHGYYRGLFEKRRPWQETAHLLVCMGLIGKDADCRGLAIDAMIEGIDYGSVDVQILSGVLIKLAKGEWLKLNRLAESLLQVAQVSSVHAWAISDLIQHWLVEIDLKQHSMFKILEVLLEVQAITKQPLKKPTQEKIATLKGSSKAAKLSKQLQNIDDTDAGFIEEIKRVAITARITNYMNESH